MYILYYIIYIYIWCIYWNYIYIYTRVRVPMCVYIHISLHQPRMLFDSRAMGLYQFFTQTMEKISSQRWLELPPISGYMGHLNWDLWCKNVMSCFIFCYFSCTFFECSMNNWDSVRWNKMEFAIFHKLMICPLRTGDFKFQLRTSQGNEIQGPTKVTFRLVKSGNLPMVKSHLLVTRTRC